MTDSIAAFIGDESGASAIEYGVLVGVVSLAILSGLEQFDEPATSAFDRAAVSLMASQNDGRGVLLDNVRLELK